MQNIWKRKERSAFPYRVPSPLVPVVADAAIATDIVGDGRFVPLVILDTSERRDIQEAIASQEKAPPGDALSAWTKILDGPKHHLALAIHLQRPIELTFAFNFDLSTQGAAVDLALKAHAIYLQAGTHGDRLLTTMEAPRMIIELGADIPLAEWTDLWSKALIQRLRGEGVRKWEAREAATRHIVMMREQFLNARAYNKTTA